MSAPTLPSVDVHTRPLEPTDIVRMAQFFYRLSPESVYKRFLTSHSDPEKLLPLMNVDQVHRAAVVATDATGEIVGVARYGLLHDDDSTAEVAVVVQDDHQGSGIGSRLMREIADVAARNGIRRFVATVLADNEPSLRMLRRLFPQAALTLNGAQYDMAIDLPEDP
jgi:RimJ/RimL family protein N-acetyltransferase